VDAITFTSASTVRFFQDALVGDVAAMGGVKVITMGPATSAAALGLGLTVHAEASSATIDALVDAVVAVLRGANRLHGSSENFSSAESKYRAD